MPKRRYKNLKNLMYEQEITQQQLSKITGIPLSTLRRRFAGHEPWDFDYIEAVAPVLNIPFAKWLACICFGFVLGTAFTAVCLLADKKKAPARSCTSDKRNPKG